MKRAPGAAALGVVADALLGDPPDAGHPVAWFGRLMDAVEQRLRTGDRDRDGIRGIAHAATGTAVGWVAGRFPGSGSVGTTVATATASGGRSLAAAARSVAAALEEGDLDRARALLPALVGRDPSGLDEKEVCRAVVESVGENTVDAVVAPALYAAWGGAPAALAYRAVNTMDAMVGHHSDRYEHYGRAAARWDDVANWAPARATAVLVAAARPSRARDVLETVRRDAPAHPSPNAGVAEAAFAAALGVSLGGLNRYGDRPRPERPGAEGTRSGRVEERARLGDGPPPSLADIERAVRLSGDVRSLLVAGLGVWSLARRRARRRDR